MENGFFAAYSSDPNEIGHTIEAAEKKNSSHIQFYTWRSTFGPGNLIDRNILPQIQNADGLIVDITVPNSNVIFEAGYAIGCQKPILPICNRSIAHSAEFVKKLGIFDNIGFQEYENSADLIYKLSNVKIPKQLFADPRPLNSKQPFYVLDAYRRSEFAAKIISAVKEQIKFFRSFDPQEEYRLSVRTAWEEVSQSSGIIVSLLSNNRDDAELHNLRASFLAGLAIGLGRPCLVLVDGNLDTPLDFRDKCKIISHPDDISQYITEFRNQVFSSLEKTKDSPLPVRKSLIKTVSLGSTASENEFRDLANYYIDTPQYKTALEGRGRIVIGRKGSGKTAIFWRVRDTLRENNNNLVVDLKPDGYQLRKFKEQLVNMLSAGTKEHTLTALWEYLIYGEIIYKIFEDDSKYYGRNKMISDLLDNLRNHYDAILQGREGDFSERMMGLLKQVHTHFQETYGQESDQIFLTTDQVTNLLYKTDIRQVQNCTLSYLKQKRRTLVLIDNIDKGWGAHGVDKDDVIIVVTLMEALRKIEREASRRDIEFDWLLMLRNDVYELLVEDQSDRGKEDKIVVDWDSYAALRQVIERRIYASTILEATSRGADWRDIAEPIIDGVDSMQWVIERCLMRPRYLIQIVNECIGQAIATSHQKISNEDFLEGYRLYSLDIIGNTNYEMRDVFPESNDAIYALIGLPRRTTIEDVEIALLDNGFSKDKLQKIEKLFFWFAVLGAKTGGGEEKYIYDYRYESPVKNL